MSTSLHVHVRCIRYIFAALLFIVAFAILFAPAAGAASSPGISWQHRIDNAFSTLLLDPPAWAANVRANTDTTGNGQHEPGLAVSPANPNVVVIANKDYRDSNIKRVWIEASTDGGQTWPTQLHMPALPVTTNESDPVVIARDDGRMYVSCLTTGNNGIFITWTDDNGVTWQPSVAVVQNQPGLQDKDWFAIDNNPSSPYYHRMYMAWAPGGVVSSYSTNGGANWSTPLQIPNNGPASIEYPYPVVAQNGDVFLVHIYNDGARYPNPSIVKVVKSTNGGVSWSQPISIATIYQPLSPPRTGDIWRFYSIISAATDPTDNNRLYAAWTDDRNHNTNGMDVQYSASTDHGTTWGPITRLSHDPTGVVRDHITPMLATSADGRLHAMWLDRRLDSANHLFQAWYSSSTDGGATWEADSQVSDAPGLGFDLNVGLPPGSQNAAGDYWGLDTVGNYVYTAWTDTRNGNQDIYTSRGIRSSGSPTPTVTGTPPTATRTSTSTNTNTPIPTSTATPTRTVTSTITALPSGTATQTSTSTSVPSFIPSATATVTGVAATSTATATTTNTTPTATPTLCPITFTDVQPSDYFYTPVRYLFCRGVISGYGTEFRPYNNTSRGQLTKIVVLGFNLPINTTGGPHFVDVPSSNVFYPYVETAYNRSIISGYGSEFRPNDNVSRGQLCKIVVLAAGWDINTTGGPHFTDVPVGSTFYSYIETGYNRGIISGYGSLFKPNDPATRGQISKIVYLAIIQP